MKPPGVIVDNSGSENQTRFLDSVLAGDPRAIARAISLVEDETPEGAALVGRLYARTGGAYLIGVTGPPGSGKSTLVDRLTAEIRRAGLTVGVIAVDPTSPFTGGAILGDRVRMSTHAGDDGVFIRSMATRGHLGGLARGTSDAAVIFDAAGKDIVIIETVGVGQDEVDIVRTADIAIVVLVPGAGDDVQALKAGIMEIADIFVVNKADRDGADRVVQSVAANLSLQTFAVDAWRPSIMKTEATSGAGVEALWAEIGRYREHSAGTRMVRRRGRHESRLRELLAHRFLQHVEQALPAGDLERLVDGIARREIDPYSAAADVMERVLSGLQAPGSGLQNQGSGLRASGSGPLENARREPEAREPEASDPGARSAEPGARGPEPPGARRLEPDARSPEPGAR